MALLQDLFHFGSNFSLYSFSVRDSAEEEKSIKLREQQNEPCSLTGGSSSQRRGTSSSQQQMQLRSTLTKQLVTILEKPTLKVKLLPNHKKDDKPMISVTYKFESSGEGVNDERCNDIIALYKMNEGVVPKSVAQLSVSAIQKGFSKERLRREGLFEIRVTKPQDTLHMEIPCSKKRTGTYIVVYMNQERRVITCSSMIAVPPRLFISNIAKRKDLVIVDFEQEPACTPSSNQTQQYRRLRHASSTSMMRAMKRCNPAENPIWIKLVDASNQILSEKECTFFRPSTMNGLNAMGTASFRIPYNKCCGFRVLLFHSETDSDPVFVSKWMDVHQVQVQRNGSLVEVDISLEDTSLCGKAWVGIYEMDGSTAARRSAWYSTISAPKEILRWESSKENVCYLICLYPGYFPINPIFEKVELSPLELQRHELPDFLADGL
mmetsp:Transcript_9257/g.34239  ORF Transcript_9257/g.34239 Transcript_9257/m.34239 type:complete len:435 (-) Transcript_9257:651-1955(-)|eukprot:CAMPEP_0117437390 /NCGR_PEP_ID=MMETSP0759-20121206/1498_1 /TAXON_ID=63605 /ORGANISM="Percolomonas cosmopolitus, Strain WS" /LENGTH=434 /DNA_ID=CAMNT_0005229019 /DNA_START=133 /DNA_END=1437 /DNA_ORIENTATION=+